MKVIFRSGASYFVFGFLIICFVPFVASAKGPTTKITIDSAKLVRPIEITDAAIVGKFQVFAGPGTSSNEPNSLIVDWASGSVTPQVKLERYRVSFYLREYPQPYVVFYAPDPSGKQGYVYVPAKGEEFYRTNVSIIVRRIEGSWFHAWPLWEDLVRPLIAGQNR